MPLFNFSKLKKEREQRIAQRKARQFLKKEVSEKLNTNVNSDTHIVPKKQTSVSNYMQKHKIKHKIKKKNKLKFKIGGIYYQRIKSRDGSKPVITGFECKKFIYCMNDIPMNIVIMKQVSGPEGKKFTLDKHECIQFHIKWEPGLEVWPIDLNWIPEKKLQNG